MLKALLEFNKKHALFNPAQDKILLAVSGGVDSMVLWHLLQKTGVYIGVAHMNFELRGDESDSDTEMVLQYAREQGVEAYYKSVNTRLYAGENNISIEMAARQLRYHWFEQVRQQYGYTKLATAHHSLDSLETIIFNLAKGTGMAGIRGIRPRRDHIIRPLLFTDKQSIEKYARANEVPWRTDQSNLEEKYSRNKIRHRIIPEMEALNPSVKGSLPLTLERLDMAARLVENEIEKVKKSAVSISGKFVKVALTQLKNHELFQLYLSEILKPYDFNYRQVQQIAEATRSIPGKVFYTGAYELTIDRDFIFIQPSGKEAGSPVVMTHMMQSVTFGPGTLHFRLIDQQEGYRIPTQKEVAALDYDCLTWPMTLAPWQKGDYFYPLGMQGRKKLSDFIIDLKIPLNLKKEIYLLKSGEDVAWVVNLRPDDRFKITRKTRQILEITFESHDKSF